MMDKLRRLQVYVAVNGMVNECLSQSRRADLRRRRAIGVITSENLSTDFAQPAVLQIGADDWRGGKVERVDSE